MSRLAFTHAVRMMVTRQCSPRALLIILVALLFAFVLLTTTRLHNGSIAALSHLTEDWRIVSGKGHDQDRAASDGPLPDYRQQDAGNRCNRDLELLRHPDLALTENIVYTRRCVKPIRSTKTDRDVVANITAPLITNTSILKLSDDCSTVEPPPCEPLTLHVPPAYPEQQYPHLLFGVATSYERMKDSLPVFAHWLAGTGAQLVAVISDAATHSSTFDLAELENEYRNSGILATLVVPTLKTGIPRKSESRTGSPPPVEQLHFLLIRTLLSHATPKTHWLSIIDDDTFFPALHPLHLALQAHDHTLPRWLGALSDNLDAIQTWGIMAFGGAGIFLSIPLARQLEPHLEDCIRDRELDSGDGMLRDCMYTHTTTKLTVVDGLYQHDMFGDIAGFYEAGRKVLSVHHWKSWYKAPVVKMAAVAAVCGDCILQRWRLGGDTLLANGYSVSVYRDGLDGVDLGLVEGTFEFENAVNKKFAFTYGPFRKRLGEREKKSYRLVGVSGGGRGAGEFRQVYVHRAVREGKGEMDEVVELIWEL